MKTELGASRGEARMALWEARSCLRRMVGVSVIDWNDTPGRTADEVKAALLAAAERAEAGA